MWQKSSFVFCLTLLVLGPTQGRDPFAIPKVHLEHVPSRDPHVPEMDPELLALMETPGDYWGFLETHRTTTSPPPAVLGYPSHPDLTTTQIVAQFGYPIEVHYLTTEDGYMLELHRIPHGLNEPDAPPGTPIFLQHGLVCSSSDWVLAGPDRGLAFLLADAGYDVWMGNIRGNTYSRGHRNASISDDDYWNFSFDDHGHYDVPAMVNFVLETTGHEKIFWVGHSMGTMMFWAAMDYHGPELADKFLGMFALGPVANLKNMVSPIKYIAPFSSSIGWIMDMLGLNEFLPSSDLFDFLASFACEAGDLLQPICTSIIFLLCGYDKHQLDDDLIPHIVGHTPAGTSTKNILHFAQGINRDGFHKFDYGRRKNQIVYGQDDPPAYDLSKVTVPVFLFYGPNDWLAVPRDVAWLKERLPNVRGDDEISFAEFNHLDFQFSTFVNTFINEPILKTIEGIKPSLR